jgi:hypothetical protein
MRGWKVFWPYERTKVLKIPVVALGSVGIHPQTGGAQVSTTEVLLQDEQLQYGPQSMEAKQGNAYWIQQWYTHPHTELIVEMTT